MHYAVINPALVTAYIFIAFVLVTAVCAIVIAETRRDR